MAIDAGSVGWFFGLGAVISLVFSVALLVLIVLGIIWLLRRLEAEPRERPMTALDDLERRYARGEMNRETFLQMRDDLIRTRN